MDKQMRNPDLNDLAFINFDKIEEVDSANDFSLYNIDYYARGLNALEGIKDGECKVGNLLISRQYVIKCQEKDSFLFHTNVRDHRLNNSQFKATFVIIHGFGENSD